MPTLPDPADPHGITAIEVDDIDVDDLPDFVETLGEVDAQVLTRATSDYMADLIEAGDLRGCRDFIGCVIAVADSQLADLRGRRRAFEQAVTQ